MEYLTAQNFKKHAGCHIYKEHPGLKVSANLSDNMYANATIIFRGIAQMWLRQSASLKDDYDAEDIITSLDEIEQIVIDSYSGATNQEYEAAEKTQLKEIAKGARRYCRDEERWKDNSVTIQLDQTIFVNDKDAPLIAAAYPDLNGDSPAKVHFDAIFIKDKTIEGVIFKGTKPFLSNSGTNSPATDMWMNICMAALEKMVPVDEIMDLKVSYYHMRNSYEKPGVSWESIPFFGNNIISLSETYANTNAYKAQRQLDSDLIDNFKAHFVGNEEVACDPDNCSRCMFNNYCHATPVPVPMANKKQKRGKQVTPSDEQSKVINWKDGILAVIAGAGSGKTECVAEHVVTLVEDYVKDLNLKDGEKPTDKEMNEILHKFFMTTFTNAGCDEMRDRVIGKLERKGYTCDPASLKITTFDAFAADIIKVFYKELGFACPPRVIDNINFANIIVSILNKTDCHGIDKEHFEMDMPNCVGGLAIIRKAIDKVKFGKLDVEDPGFPNLLKSAMDYLGTRFINDDQFYTDMIAILKQFQQEAYAEGFVTFTDLEPMALEMLDAHPDFLDEYGFERFVIDEFQDSNDDQMEFIKKFIKVDKFKSMVVVGDDFQAIYSFRNTSPDNMIHFDQKIGVPVTFKYLVDNYRSTPEILSVADTFIKANQEQLPKQLNAKKDHGKPVVVRGFYDSDSEREYIVQRVKKALDDGWLPEQIAIIMRDNSELGNISKLLQEEGIPIVARNPQTYLDNSRVNATIALGKSFYSPESTENYLSYLEALHPTLLEEYGTADINKMMDGLCAIFTDLADKEPDQQRVLFHQYLDALSCGDEIYDKFLANLYAQPDFASEVQYLLDFQKYGKKEASRMDQSYAGVTLVTAHSAKGLEWPVCIVSIAKWDNKDCHVKNTRNLEEARRLLYVAMTRAKDELVVTGQYLAYGSVKDGYTYNQFLKELYDIVGNAYVPIDPDATLKALEKQNAATERKVRLAAKEARRENQMLLAKCGGDPSKLSTVAPAAKKGAKSRPMSDAEKYAYNQLVARGRQMTIDEWLASDDRFQ